ncbi:MAG: YggT family protein [Alphaproteobacteria bacterium]|nr:YggT family protein [Alphaproteobacteria bacterium]
MGIFSSLTAAALEILYFLLGLYIGLLVVGALLSWLVVFDMVSADNRVIRAVNEVYKKLTDPILNPIRRVMPLIGGMDLSPVVLVVAIMFLRAFVWRLF